MDGVDGREIWALLVGASAMSLADEPPAGPPGEPPAASPGEPSAGTTAVLGSWLPPGISVVFASGATPEDGASSRSDPDSGGANTVAGSGTDASSEPEFTSVPAQGVAPIGTAAAAGAGGVAGTPSLAVGS